MADLFRDQRGSLFAKYHYAFGREGEEIEFSFMTCLNTCMEMQLLQRIFLLVDIVLIQKQPPEVFCKKSVLKNFLCQSLYLKKVADLRPATLLKKETLAQVFSCQFYEIFNIFLQNTFGRLLLLIFCKSTHLTHSYQGSLSIPPEIIKNQLGFLIFTGGIGRDQ